MLVENDLHFWIARYDIIGKYSQIRSGDYLALAFLFLASLLGFALEVYSSTRIDVS